MIPGRPWFQIIFFGSNPDGSSEEYMYRRYKVSGDPRLGDLVDTSVLDEITSSKCGKKRTISSDR